MIITTKNFQYRCNGLSTSEESITLVSPVEKTRYVYSLNKKVNTGYLKSTKTKELGVWSFLYIWWFCMHNEWQYIAINFLLPLYILNNLFLFMVTTELHVSKVKQIILLTTAKHFCSY